LPRIAFFKVSLMAFPILPAALMLTLVASGDNVQLTRAQLAAAQYGDVLGAAAQCKEIDQQRVGTATHRASLAVQAMVLTPDQFDRARSGFEDAARAGGARVVNKQETCADAEAALKRMEDELGH
jgi:hypothetical protein